MKKTKILLALTLVLALLLSFASCSNGTNNSTTTAASTTAAASTTTAGSSSNEPVSTEITLVDQAGRTVVLAKKAEKVASCYYISTYAVLSLGLSDKLVAVEKKANTRPIYKMANAKILDLPGVATMKEINVESLAATNPDLVIIPKSRIDDVAAIEALGLKVIVVNPETDANMREMVKLIAKACGVDAKATELLAYIDSKIGGFSAQTTPKVLMLSNSSILSAAPKNMYQNDLITLAGGINAYASNEGTYWTEISYETILALDPDYVVIPGGASYTTETFTTDAALSGLRAVTTAGRVKQIPAAFEEWDSPIPSSFLGILWLRSVLHPSEYSADSFRKDIVDFYEKFYGFTPSAEVLATIG